MPAGRATGTGTSWNVANDPVFGTGIVPAGVPSTMAAIVRPLFGDATVDFWHDRAVFHFLTDAAARAAYLAQVHRSVKPGGHVMVATFGLDGPERCSGLPVARYDAAGIHAVFGDAFVKVDEASEVHATPWGSSQAFVYCFCRRA